MPQTSIFAYPDALELSTRESSYTRLFEALKAAYGKSFADGGIQESELYAEAIVAGAVAECVTSIDAQLDPKQATWGLAALERAYDVYPEFGSSIHVRQDELALWMRLLRNSTTTDISTWLGEYLGDDFVGIWKPDPDDVQTFPANFGDKQMLFRPPAHERKNIRIIDPVVDYSAPVTLRYEPLDEGAEYALDAAALDPGLEVPVLSLAEGEELVVDCADYIRCERVTVESVGYRIEDGQQWRTFTATFVGIHNWDVVGTTYHFPFWETSAQVVAVVVKPSVMESPRKLKAINRYLRTALRHDTTWAIVPESGTKQAGPFKVNEGKIGITPIGTITVL